MTAESGGRERAPRATRPLARRLLLLASAAVLAPGVAAGPAAAQDVALERVDSLIRWGRTGEARGELSRWSEASSADASSRDLQRSLWLRAILTVDPAQAALELQRLVVEFPAGPWTDEAHLRLAQYGEVRGDLPSAARHYRALVRDHPGSPHRLAAGSWLERNRAAVRRAELAAAARREEAREAESRSEPSPDTLGRERVAGVDPSEVRAEPDAPPDDPPGAEEGDGARAGTAPAAGRAEGREDTGAGDFTVQLGAFTTTGRARALMERVRSAGFQPRLVTVPGSDFLRVRAGRFVAPGEAMELRDRLRARGFEAIFRDDAARERPAGAGGARTGER